MKARALGLLLVASAAFLFGCPPAPMPRAIGPVSSGDPIVAPPPVSTDPAPVTEGDVTSATVNGMTVLVKRMPNAELAAVQLYVRGGSRDWNAKNAGIEELALRVATTGGTASLDKEAFGRRLAALGGSLGASTSRDFSSLEAKGPTASFDALFGLLADCMLRPALPASEVEVAREQHLLSLVRRDEQPDGRLRVLVDQALFKGHPYENRPEGTAESVRGLSVDALSAHLASLRDPSRLILVAAGAVDPAHVLELARGAFGALGRGAFEATPLPRPTFATATLATETRDVPTNYIQAMFPVPGPGAPDYAAARVAMSALHERLFTEVRTKRHLSYAPGTRFDVTDAGAFGGIYVTAVDPNTTLEVMYGELRKLASTPLDDKELAGHKAQYRTRFLMGRQTTDGQAEALAMGLLRTGDWRFDARMLEAVKAVTPADVQAFARRYFGKLQVVLLGDPQKLKPELAKSL